MVYAGTRGATGVPKLETLHLAGMPEVAGFMVHPTDREVTGLVVSVHGISRNAAEHASKLGAAATRRGWAVLAPLFSSGRYPAYQRLGRSDGGSRSDLALDALLTAAYRRLGLSAAQRFFLTGFSGGAQFAHRFALLYPARVRALGLAAAGWYTQMEEDLPFPNGVGSSRRPHFHSVALDGFLRLPMILAVGEKDKRRDAALRKDPALDANQGRNRIERGRRWVESVNRAGLDRGISAERRFTMLARCGHSFRQAADPLRGNLAEVWMTFFEEVENHRERARPDLVLDSSVPPAPPPSRFGGLGLFL